MTCPSEERLARATLSRIAEPADPVMCRLAASYGPIDAAGYVRSGQLPRQFITEEAARHASKGLRRDLDRLVAGWQIRLVNANPSSDIARCHKVEGRLICPGDIEWPSQLDDLGELRPYGLWLRGRADLRFSCLRSVSIVGARAATAYGAHVAAEMAATLAERGWGVVSGGAYGVDGAAHRGALTGEGATVVVLSCGVDVTYPLGHDQLFRDVAARGVLLSEWPPGSTPTRPRFLVRNRVIAALTRGTVVVEAARRSGALNTARHAQELRRPIGAVPGPVTSPMSAGCHLLMREYAAVCVADADDVVDMAAPIGEGVPSPRREPALPRDTLDPLTGQVLEALPTRGTAGPAALAVAAGLPITTVLSCLGHLSAAGYVERHGEGWRLRRQARRRTSGPANPH